MYDISQKNISQSTCAGRKSNKKSIIKTCHGKLSMYSQGNNEPFHSKSSDSSSDLSSDLSSAIDSSSFKNIADQRALEILQNIMESKSKANSIANKEELAAEEDLVICSMTGRSFFLNNQYFKSSIQFKTFFIQDG